MRSKHIKEETAHPTRLKGGYRLKVAYWNVRTMLVSYNNTRRERRSALIAHELARLDIDIAALSEIRFSEEGCVTERGAGCTLYRPGTSTEERRLSRFMIRDSIATKLTNLPVGHSDRIISIRMSHSVQQHATVFSVGAPTLHTFYTDLRGFLRNIPPNDDIVILSYFNARVGGHSKE